ncbi:efflux RND transporter permease subunit [Evansella halocellulosilytica]|uniref:efflux RND transporter permease subunit n=1 Tax=Evansella halocellulosilytica TaxID=2011013 RepID=UPI000BB8567D|nr:efflux RND transporter permease subunit [Evansella halocellulosilytica]
MMKLTEFSLKNPVAIFILSALCLVGGVYAFTQLDADFMPETESNVIDISIQYPGASPQDVHDHVTEVVEEAFIGFEHMRDIETASYEDQAYIHLIFSYGVGIEERKDAAEDVLQEVALPEEVEVDISSFTFDDLPILDMAIMPVDENSTTFQEWVLEDLAPELSSVPGVYDVIVEGKSDTWMELVVENEQAMALGLSLQHIQEALSDASFSHSAGTFERDGDHIPVRVSQDTTDMESLEQLALHSPVTGEAVAIGDISRFETVQESSGYTRYNAQDALSLAIYKRGDVNTVDVADQVMDVLNSYEERMHYAIHSDNAATIDSSVRGMIETGILGALLTSLIVLVFLRNLRAMVIAVLSIPLSLLIAAIFLNMWSLSLNVITLAAMAVAVGRVVDDSIIVIENIYRKFHQHPDEDRTLLTISGTKEMMKPIITSTLTSILVFLPLGLLSGNTDVGEFMMPFALTIVFALIASTVISLTLVPIMARFSFIKLTPRSTDAMPTRYYERLLRWSLGRKFVVVTLATVLLFGSLPLVGNLGFVFLPDEENRLLQAEVLLPVSSTLERTNETALQLEESLMEHQQDYPHIYTSVGTFDVMSGMTFLNRVEFVLDIADHVQIDEAVTHVQELLESQLPQGESEAVINVQEAPSMGPPTNNHVHIDLFAEDAAQLQEAALMVEGMMDERDDVRYVQNNLREELEQWTVHLNTLPMNSAGLTSLQVWNHLTDKTQTLELGALQVDDELYDLRAVYSERFKDPDDIEQMMLYSEQGMFSISDVAHVEEGETVTSIRKLNGKEFARVAAQVMGDDVLAVSEDVKQAVEHLDLPSEVTMMGSGGSDDTADMFGAMIMAILLSIGLVYITLLLFFGKSRLPFVILTSVLFMPIGAFLALWLANEPLSMSAMIGLLMLVGIVVANAIVLIDKINHNREEGMPIRESVVQAGKTRLRPIFMTTLATIVALLPLAFATPEGGIVSRGMAIVVIGGLMTSTFLTLIIVPLVYEFVFRKTLKNEQMKGK